jgi:hypothetical protein
MSDLNYNGIDDAYEWTPTYTTNDANYNGIDDAYEWTPTYTTNDANYNGIDDAYEWTPTYTSGTALPPTTADLLNLPSEINSLFGAPSSAGAPVWETAPADDLGAALAFAEHLVDNPYDHPALAEFEGLNETIDAIAGPEAIASIVGSSVTPQPGETTTQTLDRIAMELAVRGPLSATTGVPVDQFNLKSGTGLQLNPFFGNSTAGSLLGGMDDWVNDLIASAQAKGEYGALRGGIDGLIAGQTNQIAVSNEVNRWNQILQLDNARLNALEPGIFRFV